MFSSAQIFLYCASSEAMVGVIALVVLTLEEGEGGSVSVSLPDILLKFLKEVQLMHNIWVRTEHLNELFISLLIPSLVLPLSLVCVRNSWMLFLSILMLTAFWVDPLRSKHIFEKLFYLGSTYARRRLPPIGRRSPSMWMISRFFWLKIKIFN